MQENPSGRNYEALAARFTDAGDWARLDATAMEWLAEEPESTAAHFARGQALLNSDRDELAIPHLEQVLAKAPGYAAAHRFHSIALFKAKRFREADSAIKRAIELSPNDAWNWYHAAWIAYKENDKASARHWLAKARELNPNDSDILNLSALCAEGGIQKLGLYRQALEQNPENANAHNNICSYHLNETEDYAAAEAAIRQALSLDPANPIYRKNLFICLKQRDPVYRALCAPRDFVSLFLDRGRYRGALRVLMTIAWVLLYRVLLPLLALWFLMVWPAKKFYEWLTLGDLKAQAGEIGARRGGPFNWRAWPRWARLALFCMALSAFWYGGYRLAVLALSAGSGRDDIVGGLVAASVVGFLAWRLAQIWKRNRTKARAQQRAKVFADMGRQAPYSG